ncbi:3-beta hydroxysteroid dehydrogenase/isomerase family protein [Trichostrongylus colubriformis]|uniref:3-beta hydroxysteroid dehydrogenase/isomerase family protein n=1 Tax=Trichostrongylus colubriformis TaxID=6319 RepID=A0AAN8EUR4_TRICO
MQVCIVGGGGYLGCQLASRLQSQGVHTVLLDVAFPLHPNIVLDEKLTSRIQGTLLNETIVREALTGCESCFHLAAYGMSGLQAFNRKLIHEINVDGTLLLLDCCKRMGITRFIFASSVGVIFTNKELVNATEDHPYPDDSEYVSEYSASKAQAERAVLDANCATLRTCALRLRGVYGPGEPRCTDRAAEIIYRGLYIATFCQKSSAMTQYSGVHNVTHAMCQADKELAKAQPRCAGKPYHVVDANPVDSFLFWLPLIKALSKPAPSIRIPFWLVYFAAILCEWLAMWFHIPPILNRLEVNLLGITNTYSIEGAIKDFDYKPTNNHDLAEVVKYYEKYYQDHPLPLQWFDTRRAITNVCIIAMLMFFLARYLFS